MGDRALVVFHDDSEVSPTVYLHWSGGHVQNMLEAALPRMRKGDVSYSCARFIGVCNEWLSGRNTGFGVFNSPGTLDECKADGYSHGDAGVFLVDVNTWRVEAFNGYGFDKGEMVLQLDAAQVSD